MIETTVTFRCDTGSGHGEARTVRFGIDGRQYEREACTDCELDFALDIGQFILAARPAGPPAPKRDRSTATELRKAAIRQWARERGIDVKDKGRIADGIVARYEAEHGAGR